LYALVQINDRHNKYFDNLFNEGYKILPDYNKLDIREEDRDYNYYPRIQEHVVKEALKMMCNGKKIGPANIAIEV
jgi:hypothetical protein